MEETKSPLVSVDPPSASIAERVKAILPLIASPTGFVSLYIATFTQIFDDPGLRLVLAYAAGALEFIAIVFLVLLLRPKPWSSMRKWISGVTGVIVVFALGVGAAFVYQYKRDAYGPAITLSVQPASYAIQPPREVRLKVSYRINRTDRGLCNGHLWLIDHEPVGKVIVENGISELEKVHVIVDNEILCRRGNGVIEFKVQSVTASHELAVWNFNQSGNREWAQLQWDLHHETPPIYKQDGLFVSPPRKANRVSNTVDLQPA